MIILHHVPYTLIIYSVNAHRVQYIVLVSYQKKDQWYTNDYTQLEVQWPYSGHLVHLQWGTVHALHAIYSGHCRYTLYCFTVGLQYALQHTVRPLQLELGKVCR